MQVKIFHAFTMQEAIRAIEAELGPDAVILSTKEIPKQKALTRWFGRPLIEVTAAIDRHPSSKETPVVGPTPKSATVRQKGKPEFHETLLGAMHGAASIKPPHTNVENPSPRSEIGRPLSCATVPQLVRIRTELRALHQHLVKAYPGDTIAVPKSVPDRVASLYRDLVGRGASSLTATSIVQEIHARLPGALLFESSRLREVLYGILAQRISTSRPLLTPGEPKKTALFLGPSGAGKTTAIVKLAAHYRMEQHRSVAIITLDTYRLAVVEQLRLYATTLGIPLDVALTRREVVQCLKRRRDTELFLIDTGGRNQTESLHLEDLRGLTALDQPVETHLVLAANTREQDLLTAVHRFAGIPVDRLLFTKLDETLGVGSLLTVQEQTGIPLSYFSTGPRVPVDFEPAGAERLAGLLLGETLQGQGFSSERISEDIAHTGRFESAGAAMCYGETRHYVEGGFR